MFKGIDRDDLQIALQAARLGAQLIVDNIDNTYEIDRKAYSEIVTDIDRLSNSAIIGYLQRARPDHGILSEESPEISGSSGFTWVVDPLDGSCNYLLGIPHAGVSIALCDPSTALAGVVVNPFRKFQYIAEIHNGVSLNDHPIHVSQTSQLGKATIGHIVSYKEKREKRALDLFIQLRATCYRLLDTWSPSLDWCLLAQGKIDALVCLGVGKVDRVAGALIVQEAGGVITDFEGKHPQSLEEDYLLASNGTDLHAILLEIIRNHYSPHN